MTVSSRTPEWCRPTFFSEQQGRPGKQRRHRLRQSGDREERVSLPPVDAVLITRDDGGHFPFAFTIGETKKNRGCLPFDAVDAVSLFHRR